MTDYPHFANCPPTCLGHFKTPDKDCDGCDGRGWIRTGLSDAETCDECTEGVLLSLNDQRDRILAATLGSTDEDRNDVDALDAAIITYASIRTRIELMSILKACGEREDSPTYRSVRRRIAELTREPVK